MARNRALRAGRVRAVNVAPVAIITGAGRGIGRAAAQAFAAEGYAVVIAELRAALGRRAERELAAAGRIAVFLHTDVTDPASVGQCVRSALRRFGRVDCLVNNAGVLRLGMLSDLLVSLHERDHEDAQDHTPSKCHFQPAVQGGSADAHIHNAQWLYAQGIASILRRFIDFSRGQADSGLRRRRRPFAKAQASTRAGGVA